ncbi:MAG: 4a-hydroxytetrahydrobiopterin dehydratase [Candidatus Levybacteria bacterium]|nr:4a-hydroxytetrahydrobiopterin dehydratase [Candidatus Levybacteria bacterium]
MDKSLVQQKCVPCEGNIQPLTREQFSHYLPMVPDWTVVEDKKIERDFKFKNFAEAIEFINKVAGIAEEEGHHPDIYLHNWNRVRFSLMTHAIKGLFLNDFILASKIDSLFAQ